MKFRMFTNWKDGQKVAVNVDAVQRIDVDGSGTMIMLRSDCYVIVREDFDTVLSRLNTIAE